MKKSTELKHAIKRWLKSRGDHDAAFISRTDWNTEYGTSTRSPFVLDIYRSPLYLCLNYGEDKWEAESALRRICAEHGFYYEHATSWALDFFEAK
jgi:hypothetical protein